MDKDRQALIRVTIGVLSVVILFALLFFLTTWFWGCCETLPPPTTIVQVKGCVLPPGPGLLPGVERTEQDCPEKLVCFNMENAAKLAQRNAILEQWIKETKTRCATSPDAGSDAPIRGQ